jgi:hypothetical protein
MSSQDLADLANALSELEMTQQMLEEAAALSQMAESESQSLGEGLCKSGNCQGGQGMQAGQQGSQLGQGNRRGGPGRAQGGNSGKARTPTGTKAQKAKTQHAGGDIIARQLIDNPNPEVAESVMPRESIGEALDGGAGMAVGEDQVPAHLQDAHKHYFGGLKREIQNRAGGAKGAETTSGSTTSGSTTSGAGAPAPSQK